MAFGAGLGVCGVGWWQVAQRGVGCDGDGDEVLLVGVSFGGWVEEERREERRGSLPALGGVGSSGFEIEIELELELGIVIGVEASTSSDIDDWGCWSVMLANNGFLEKVVTLIFENCLNSVREIFLVVGSRDICQ